MCRLAAYLGPEIYLARLLDDQPNSLVRQSWDPQEMNETRLNADGFGFGWYTHDQYPVKYTNILPIWSDGNLVALGRSLKSPVWLANVRSATPGQETSLANTQPFIHDQLMYLHNGYLEGFNQGVRQRFHEFLAPAIQATIRGNTDSEYLFALLQQSLQECDGQLRGCLKEGFDLLERILVGRAALLNIVLYNGSRIIACRHAMNGAVCPTLYYCTRHPDYPGAVLVTSERFSNHECWTAAPPHSMLEIKPDRPVELSSL